jgi:eukaryotic-like serine/threonine-protein kinase
VARAGIADYEFVREIGEGNYGTFHLAKKPDRLPVDAEFVAVKLLASKATEDTYRRATRELQLFASIRSEYLVRLFDAGMDGSTFYYAMEYHPLGSLAKPARPLERSEVLHAVACAARAAHALHEAGCVHRDIKPANILLREDGAVLSDLGLAQVLNPGQTMTGSPELGSIEFVDPAVMRGDRPSRASDIWALGATLHRALTGSGIYGELPVEPLLALRKVISSQPELSSSLADGEAEVIRRCLDADPSKRPGTAAEVAAQIEALEASG